MLADNACSSDGDTSEDVCDVLVDTRYTPGGGVFQRTMPYALAANPTAPWRGQHAGQAALTTSYDVLGRPLLATAPDGAATGWSYTTGGTSAPDGYRYTEVCQTQANGATTCTRRDLFGRVRKVIPPSGPALAYTYDVEDQLLQVQRGGATTSLSYDLGGRKLQMSDPDMGVWNYAYDALGNLIRQIDARGQYICLYYDGLNRLTGKHFRNDDVCPTSSPSFNLSYSYDAGTYGKGYRTGMSDASGSTTWIYDTRGRVVDETKTVTGVGSFHSSWSYTSADLLASQSFPADAAGGSGEILTFSYHPQAALKSVLSSLSYYYVQNMTYDAAGRVDLRKLGAANLGDNPTLLTDFDYYLWNIPGGQGRLQRLKSGTAASTTSLQDFSYTYDVLGNVSSIVDAKAGGTQTQSFSYDLLDRLLSSQASGGNQGVYALESYAYNASSGNLSTKAGVSYSYAPQSGSCPQGALSKPHAVTSAFCYDQNGNMVRRTTGGSVYNLTYDAENRLVSVSGAATATFVYDGDGNRVKATVGGATTTYIGDSFEWSGSTATMKKYYAAAGMRLAVRTGSTPLNWLLGDHLGSTNITADNSAIQVGKLLYKPWGEERFVNGTTPTTIKFTGQRQESSFGLYLVASRWYDPALARWAQPDSIVPGVGEGGDPNAVGCFGESNYSPLTVDYHENQLLEQLNNENSARLQDSNFRLPPVPTNSSALDRYAYSLNSPVRYTDPTGHCPFCVAIAITVGAVTPVGWVVIGLGVGSALVIYAVGPENIAESLVNVGKQVGETVNETAIGLAAIGLAGKLPKKGEFPYVTPKQKGNPPYVRAPQGGFRDANGNIWRRDKSGHGGSHWDVEHPDGSHTNVDDTGKIIRKKK